MVSSQDTNAILPIFWASAHQLHSTGPGLAASTATSPYLLSIQRPSHPAGSATHPSAPTAPSARSHSAPASLPSSASP